MADQPTKYRLSEVSEVLIDIAVLKHRLGDAAGAEAALREARERFATELQEHVAKVPIVPGAVTARPDVAKAPELPVRGTALFPELERQRAEEHARRVAMGMEDP